jgi:hypothetical protein
MEFTGLSKMALRIDIYGIHVAKAKEEVWKPFFQLTIMGKPTLHKKLCPQQRAEE